MNRIIFRTKIIQKCSKRYINDNYVIYHPPSLKNIPRRWNNLSTSIKEEIQEYLDWQMTGDWRDMTIEEKKCVYYISYGSWGPRSTGIPSKDKAYSNSNNSNEQMNIPYLVIRGLFNLVLFSALGVCIINLQKDKQFSKKTN